MLVRWRRLGWVTWRQHRASLLVVASLFVLTAATMWLSSLDPRGHTEVVRAAGFDPTGPVLLYQVVVGAMVLLPVVAGLLLGAPLLAHESESGTVRFAWTQQVGRVASLTVKATSIGAGLAIAAAALGLEYDWWAVHRITVGQWDWATMQFSFHPLPYAGWAVFGFSLGVLIGAVTRRTVPALAGTFVGYTIVFTFDNVYGRLRYLPPLRTVVPEVPGGTGGDRLSPGQYGPENVGGGWNWPDGRPLTVSETYRSPAWMARHHVVYWTTSQPGNRYHLFQFLEFGYLLLLSGLLVAAAIVLIRRRSA
ncbi:MAG TPA: hypothetical protein VFI65_06685 [Streptosporangiaceae bacterium]|nr:hypothetical protein [Streptosporangiaceae bacterium]